MPVTPKESGNMTQKESGIILYRVLPRDALLLDLGVITRTNKYFAVASAPITHQ